MKKILGIFVAIVAMFTLSVHADELVVSHYVIEDVNVNQDIRNNNVSYERPKLLDGIDEFGLRGTSKPNGTWDLSTSGDMTFSGTSQYHILYTNKYFKGASSINIGFTALPYSFSNYNSITYDLYKYGLISDTKLLTHTVSVNANQIDILLVSGLNSTSKYYLKIYNPSHFTGYVTKIS